MIKAVGWGGVLKGGSVAVKLTIRQSQVQVLLWSLAGFVLGRPAIKSSATLVNSPNSVGGF